MEINERNKYCGAPWGCSELSSKASGKRSWRIGNTELCRKCYSYVWEHAKDLGKTMVEIFHTLSGPNRSLPCIATKCARKGCTETFADGEGAPRRRHIGLLHICKTCYQAAWEMSRTFDPIISLEQALLLLPERNLQRVPLYHEVKCAMPWCDRMILSRPDNKLNSGRLETEGIYLCGRCRSYLKNNITARYNHRNNDWYHWAVEAIRGRVVAPNSHEPCAMPWCQAVIVPTAFGPQGQPICRTDEVRLRLYAKREGVSFSTAFLTAPPPRWGIKRRVGIPEEKL